MKPHEILPPPETQSAPELAGSKQYVNEQDASKAVEQQPTNSAGRGAIHAAALGGAQSQLQQTVSSVGGSATTSDNASLTMTADDNDLIEKEWVLRAKAIVAATVSDPFAQNLQINRVKAEYIKKRFNKDVKYKEE